jgi:NADP-dependent 3-hydroxy acid dehydrogenase YdfG
LFKRDRTSTLYLKQQGFNIYATVKNRSDIDQLKSLGLNTYYLDVTDIKSIQDTINTIISKEKSLDVVFITPLINNMNNRSFYQRKND